MADDTIFLGKADKRQDQRLLLTAPDNQGDALNRLIGLMNAANGDLAHVLVIILERVRQEELRFSWLEWAELCAGRTIRSGWTQRVPVTKNKLLLRLVASLA